MKAAKHHRLPLGLGVVGDIGLTIAGGMESVVV
jgi:hypothetical protein